MTINLIPHEVEVLYYEVKGVKKFHIHASNSRSMVFNATTYVGEGQYINNEYVTTYTNETGEKITNSYQTLDDAMFWTSFNRLQMV